MREIRRDIRQEPKQERSIGELFAELAKETSTLVRQEVALAKAELSEKAAVAGKNAGYLVLGGAVAYAALLAFAAAAIIALGHAIPLWLSAVLVGVVIAIVAAVLVTKALAALKETGIAPRQTVQSIKEDVQWAKDKMR